MVSKAHAAVRFVAVLLLFAGCRSAGVPHGAPSSRDSRRIFLTVDFQPGQTLRYRFVSHRDLLLDWDPNAVGGDQAEKRFERLEMVTAYTPVVVDPYGVSTIRAVCESVTVERSGRQYAGDAAESAAGKTFLFTIDPRGKMVDRTELDALVQEMGAKAFRSGPSGGRVKDPDMIGDFVAGQYFLWDAISSVEAPACGIAVGQTWPSRLPVPLPMVARRARDVTYRFSEIRADKDKSLAILDSVYSPADAAPTDWPIPYSGRFQMSGTFGFLGSYRLLALEGAGQESFDLDAGRVVADRQKYIVRMKASLPPMGIRADPHLTIEQTLTTELLAP